ncbi:MAG: hypothetical protein WC433_05055 [Candidatus Omnitrophota bacterium]|jgi:hypothetical protein
MINRFGQLDHLLPVLSPADISTSDTNTVLVNLSGAHRCTFEVSLGTVTCASTTTPIFTVLAATSAATTTATAIAFKYRKSGIVGVDTYEEVADATSSGLTITKDTDVDKVILIDVDPAVVAAAKADCRWVYVHIDTAATISALEVGVNARVEPRYIAATPESAT